MGGSHSRAVIREEWGPRGEPPTHSALGSGRLLRGGDGELAAKEERALDSWRRGGERCWQRKLGMQKQEVGRSVGLESSESLSVAGAGHAEGGRMQQWMRPEKQLSVFWCKPNHVAGNQHGSMCRGSLASNPAVPTNSRETLVESCTFSALELSLLSTEEHARLLLVRARHCLSEPQPPICKSKVIRGLTS